jgi:hypothetical protein
LSKAKGYPSPTYEDGRIPPIRLNKEDFIMNRNGNKGEFVNMARVGNYTKNAVENFEENIVTQKDYLEKVNDDDTSKKANK